MTVTFDWMHSLLTYAGFHLYKKTLKLFTLFYYMRFTNEFKSTLDSNKKIKQDTMVVQWYVTLKANIQNYAGFI